MRKSYFKKLLGIALAAGSMMVSCSSDAPRIPDDPIKGVAENEHFDLWIALDRHGGMGRNVQTLVRSLNSVDASQPMIDFVGEGVEVNSILTLETIYKGKYYYQVPVSGDRFAKYTVIDNKVTQVAAQPFVRNSYSPRQYCYAWLDDSTLLIMAGDGARTKIVWTKLNADNMTILSEGELSLQVPEGAKMFSAAGHVAYRKSDNKLFYFYNGKSASGMNATSSPSYTAVINASTMAVESVAKNTLAAEMPNYAYGELLQRMIFSDEAGNIYAPFFTTSDSGEKSSLLRINSGQTDFDPSYNGFTNSGKLLAMEYLGDNQAVIYARDDDKGTGIDAYSHYYAILDIVTGKVTRLSYNGQVLPYSGGRFSSRLATARGKAYIGLNPKDSNPCIYIYDSKTKTVEKGAELSEGYYFEHIRVLEN